MKLQDAFLQDILANPEDDTVRMIYADWLTEQGNPRGEFIHLQIRLMENLPACQAHALRLREQELLRKHALTWLCYRTSRLLRWVFRRGFVGEIDLRADAFLNECSVLMTCEPITRLRLHWATSVLPELTVSPSLHNVSELDLSYNYLNDLSLELLAVSPHLKRLRTLNLAHNVLRQRGAETLAATPALGQLQRLDLSGNHFSAGGRQLLQARFGDALRL
jgi:uncharacterized protein (TIGR02996 family)